MTKIIGALFLVLGIACHGGSFTNLAVVLAWDHSPSGTNVEGYMLRYGPTGGTTVSIGYGYTNQTGNIVVQRGATYLFELTATNQFDESEPARLTFTVPDKLQPPVLRIRISLQSACNDPAGPWTTEKLLDQVELVSDEQRFWRTKVDIETLQ